MLAREVQLTTTRFQGCGDSEGQSWHFTTHGLSDFGELRPAKITLFPTGGTRVEWDLRPERIGDEEKFAEDLREYLRNTLIRIPCTFEFKVEGYAQPVPGWQRPTGWTLTLEEWKERIVSSWSKPEEVFANKEFLLSLEDAARQQSNLAIYATALNQARAALRLEENEVPLPNGLGWTRLILPYFDLPQGRSLFFPILNEQGSTLREDFDGLHAPTSSRTAWKGMACHIAKQPALDDKKQKIRPINFNLGAFASETDIQQVDRQTLEVSRLSLVLPRGIAASIGETLAAAAQDSADTLLNRSKTNFYGELNLALQGRPLTLEPGAAWFLHDGKTILRPLTYPLAIWDSFAKRPHLAKASNGAVIPLVKSKIHSSDEKFWEPILPTPDRLFMPTYSRGGRSLKEFVRCWEQPPASRSGTIQTCFPGEWQALALVYKDHTCMAWQAEHPLIRLLSEDERTSLLGIKGYNFSPNWEALHSVHSPGEIALHLLSLTIYSCFNDQSSFWQQFQANHPDQVSRLWQTLAEASGRPIASLAVLALSGFHSVSLTPEGMVYWSLGLSKHNPIPEVTDPEFLLVETAA
jgi:hypothetical protein